LTTHNLTIQCCGTIGATLYVAMVTCHHHFFKVEFAIFNFYKQF